MEQMHSVFQIGEALVVPSLNELRIGDRTIHVKPRSMSVLECLLKGDCSVVTRRSIFSQVWGDSEVSDEVLTQAITELRKAFGEGAKQPTYIQTVPRRGYRLMLPTLRVVSTQQKPVTDSLAGYTGFVGRRAQLELLVDALEHLDDEGSAFLVKGEAGIGKTSLMHRLEVHTASKDYTVIKVSCSEHLKETVLYPIQALTENLSAMVDANMFAAWLGDAGPEIFAALPGFSHEARPTVGASAVLPAEVQQRYLFNAYRAFLRRASEYKPTLFLIDDLQWADELSVAMLIFLMETTSPARLMFVATVREPNYRDKAAITAGFNDLLVRNSFTQIQLDPLETDEVRTMVTQQVGRAPPFSWAEALRVYTNGNPFYVSETIKYLTLEGKLDGNSNQWPSGTMLALNKLSDSLQQLLNRRFAAYQPALLDCLRTAALMGTPFSAAILQSVLSTSETKLVELLAEAERQQILSPVTERHSLEYHFRHDIERAALAAGLTEVQRCLTHRNIAQAMADAELPARRAAQIVFHLENARDLVAKTQLLEYTMLAGNYSAQNGAANTALTFAAKAFELAATEDRSLHGQIELLRGRALRGLSKWLEAIKAWQSAIKSFRASSHKQGIVECCCELALVFTWQGDVQKLDEICELGLTTLAPDEHATSFSLLCLRAMGLGMTAELAAAEQAIQQARNIANQTDSPYLRGVLAPCEGSYCLSVLDVQAAISILETAIPLQRQTRNLWSLSPSLAQLQLAQSANGNWDAVMTLTDEVNSLADQVGHVGAAAWGVTAQALAEFANTGDVVNFNERANAMRQMASDLDLTVVQHVSELMLADVALWQGKYELAGRMQTTAADDEPALWSLTSWALSIKLDAHRSNAQDPQLISQRVEQLVHEPQLLGWNTWRALPDLAEGLHLAGQSELLGGCYDRISALVANGGACYVPAFTTSLQRMLGMLAASELRWDQAVDHFELAVSEFALRPHKFEHAETMFWLAWTLQRRGSVQDLNQAASHMVAAEGLYQILGLEARLESLVRRLVS